MKTKIRFILILALEWFDKVNGNSYFSANIYVNGNFLTSLPFQYGYGEQYIQEATKKLNELEVIKLERYSIGALTPLWRYCRENNIKLLTDKAIVTKKEVKNFVA